VRAHDPPAGAPLAGYRVVCLAVYVPAPAGARRLAALGAEVTRVEPPEGDPLERWSPAWYGRSARRTAPSSTN